MKTLPRAFVLYLSLLFFLMVLPTSAADGPLATIQSGQVRGKTSADGKVNIFLGIPFAAPPVGPLRWKEPQPVTPWTTVRDATNFGARCMQSDVFKGVVFRDSGMSEDCLYLNVWAPAAKDSAKLPVMVWLYGGSFFAGSGSEARYDGEPLAHRGVIIVTLNYRLGIFGFFATQELAAESAHHSAGNYGYLDQSAAIRWVHDNIAAFGGDPANITIFGESAGSFSVNAQMTSPLTRQFIAKAIGESGGGNGRSVIPCPDLATAEKRDEKYAKNNLHADNLAALRAISADELTKKTAPKLFSSAWWFIPVIDGYFRPETVDSTWAAGKQAQIPVVAGTNLDEPFVSVSKLGNFNVNALNFALFQRFGLHAGEAQKLFHASNDQEAIRAGDDMNGMEFVGFTAWAWLESQANTPIRLSATSSISPLRLTRSILLLLTRFIPTNSNMSSAL